MGSFVFEEDLLFFSFFFSFPSLSFDFFLRSPEPPVAEVVVVVGGL